MLFESFEEFETLEEFDTVEITEECESFLEEERGRLKKVISQGDTLNIVAKEKKVEVVKILEENTFRLYGKIDRIDQLNELYRIIDYKTGKVDSSELSFKNWEDLIENPN